MPPKPQEKPGTTNEHGQSLSAIGKHVLDLLGEPSDLHRVLVRPLWEDRYRVNILVGPDAASAKIAHSYFLLTTNEGSILASTPKITKQY
jgi:hypothetical protein